MQVSKRRGKRDDPEAFPIEEEPTPGVRASTLGPAGYAPQGLVLQAHGDDEALLPHIYDQGPEGPATRYRALMVVNVPRSALYPDATSWGAFDMSQPVNVVHARALAFLCAAINRAATNAAAGQLRVFAEVMLRETKALPVGADSMEEVDADYVHREVFAPPNVMGYRLWFVFGTGVPDPEVVLRRQIFAMQQEMRLLPEAVVAVKNVLCPVFDEHERDALVHSYAMTMAAKRRKSGGAPAAKRRAADGGDGDASDGDEPAADAGSDDDEGAAPAAPSPKAMAAAVLQLKAQMRERPSNTRLGRLAARRVRFGGNLAQGVASMDTYLRDVVASAHYMSRTAEAEAIRSRWGVAPALALPDAEMLWLPAESDDVAAVQCWSFERSVLTFYSDVREDSACTEQLDIVQYGLADGRLSFPLRHAVWELAPRTLAPLDFFTETMPWTGRRFEAAVRQLEGAHKKQALAEETAARETALRRNGGQALVPDTAELRLQASMSSMSRSSVAGRDERRAHIKEAAARARAAVGRERAEAAAAAGTELAHKTATDQSLDELRANYTLAPFMAPADINCVETEQLMAAVIPAYRRANITLDLGVAALRKLKAPDGVDAAVWHAEQLCALHQLFRTDLLAELMGIIMRNVGVPEVHRRSMERICATGRLSDAYEPNWCRLPQMSVEANAMVALGAKLVAGVNMAHGMLETVEYLAVAALQATDPEPTDMVHTIIYGQKATGKSYNADRANEALLSGAVARKDWQSAASAYTHSNDGNHIHFLDEGTEILTDHSRESQRRNAGALARLKQQLTSNEYPFERYYKEEGDARSRVQRVMAKRPGVQVAFANHINISPGADAALLDRMNVTAFAPSALSHLMAVQRAHDSFSAERAAIWRQFCEQYKTEMAFKTMLVLLARSRVIASVNTDVLKAMLNQALGDVGHLVPAFGEAMRAAGRHEQFATALIFHTAFYTVMRSEASELVRWLGPGVSHSVLPAFFADVATIFGPHLYARADHGCWMLTQMVRVNYPFVYYNVLRAVTGTFCNFRRAQLVPIYRDKKAELIDDRVAERLAERDAEGQVMPDFVNELLRAEALLDYRVSRTSAKPEAIMPHFLTTGDAKPQVDPNWLVLPGTLGEVAARITPLVQTYYKMDESQVRTMLTHAATIKVRTPVFKIKDAANSASLAIGMLEFERNGASTIVGQPCLVQEQPLVRIVGGSGGGRDTDVPGSGASVRISTGAMMLPPQLLLVLMLTASETMHTEPLQTVLPLEFGHNAQLMHTWRVSRRPGHNPVFVNSTAVTHSFVRMERRTGASDAGVAVTELSATVQSANTDMVRTAFYRHMRALHQMPPYASVVAQLRAEAEYSLAQAGAVLAANADDAGAYERAAARLDQVLALDTDTPTAEQHEQVFRAWADASPAAPGASVARRAWAFRASEGLAASVANRLNIVHYPHANALDQTTQTFLLSHAAKPLPPIARRGRHQSIVDGVARMDVGASAAGLEYAQQRHHMRVLMRLMCIHWRPMFAKHAAGVEWRHVAEMIVAVMWSPADADEYVRTGRLPARSPLLTHEQAAETDAVDKTTSFSISHLRLLAEWLNFVHTTRRIGLALRRNPALGTIQHAYDSLLLDDEAETELRDAADIDAIRAAPSGMAIDLSAEQQQFYQSYCLAMDRLRPLRAARLSQLLARNEEALVAEEASAAAAKAAAQQSERNSSVSRLAAAPAFAGL